MTLDSDDLTAIIAAINAAKPFVTLADGVAHGGTPGSSTATLSLHNMCLYAGSGAANLNNEPLLIQAGDDGAPAVAIASGSGPNGGQCVLIHCQANDNQAVYIRTGDGGAGTSAAIGIYQFSPAPGIEIFGGTHDIALSGSGDIFGNLAGKVLGGGSGVITGAGVDVNGFSSAALIQLFTDVLTESYAADEAEFTLSQALYMLYSLLSERSFPGTQVTTSTLTMKKLDGTTPWGTFTVSLDAGGKPFAQTRAT